MLKGKYLGNAQIKDGAIIGQDHGFYKWENGGELFEVYEFIKGRKNLIRDGYGRLGCDQYGNGSLFVKDSDILWEDEDKMFECATVLG